MLRHIQLIVLLVLAFLGLRTAILAKIFDSSNTLPPDIAYAEQSITILTPTPDPNKPVIVGLNTDATTLHTGQVFTATVTFTDQPGGCYYARYDLTLKQQGNLGLVAFETPFKVGPPVDQTVNFRMRAVQPGLVTLQATAFGETYCNAWAWRSVSSNPVYILIGAYAVYLPQIIQN